MIGIEHGYTSARVQEGQPVEVLTCVVEDMNMRFVIDETIWTSFDEALPMSEDVEVYVAFEHREVQQLSSGEVVEVLNRAVEVPKRIDRDLSGIVVFDLDSASFQTVQKAFFNDNVEVIWASTLDREQLSTY